MDPRNVIITFPELLLWFPLVSGLIVLLLRKGDRAKNWSLVFSVITLAISIASFIFTDPKYRALNQVSYYWLPQIGSSFALMLDGVGRILCFLTPFAYPVIFLTTYKHKYKNANILWAHAPYTKWFDRSFLCDGCPGVLFFLGTGAHTCIFPRFNLGW